MKTEQHLEGAFGRADEPHFEWQTSSPYVGERERELAHAAFLPLGNRVLDLGCAEGATLYHLDAPKGTIGLDVFEDKLQFARKVLPHIDFICGSAYALPFEDGRFDQILVRDVIHHIDDAPRAIAEAARVLEPGGRIDLLEPCRYNPLIFMHAVTNKAERGELRSTPAYLSRLLAPHFEVTRVQSLQAMPIHRLVFHLHLGKPAWAGRPGLARAVGTFERAAEFVVPKAMWAYIHVRGVKR